MDYKGKYSVYVTGLFAVLFISVLLSSSAQTVFCICCASIIQHQLNILRQQEKDNREITRKYSSKTLDELVKEHNDKLNLIKDYTAQVDEQLFKVQDKVTKL